MNVYSLYGIPTVLDPTFVMVAPLPIIVEYLRGNANPNDAGPLLARIWAESRGAGECLITFDRESSGRMGNWVVVPGAKLPKETN